MKLHSPEFEQRLRRGVREAIRSSRELRKEARRTRRPKQYSFRLFWRLLLAAAPALIVWWISRETKNPAAVIGFVSLWMFLWLCARVEGIRTCLYSDPALNAFSLLPIRPDDLFRWQLQKFLRASVMSLVDLLAALATFGAIHSFAAGQWLILILIALLSWVTLLALVFFCAAHWPRFPYGMVWGFALLAGIVCLFGQEFLARHLLALFNTAAPVFNLLPTGWPLNLSRLMIEPGQWPRLLLLIPVVGVISGVKGSLARLQKDYTFTEIATDEAPDLIPGDAAPPQADEQASAGSLHHLGETAIEELILSRQFFASPKWHEAGRSERLLWRWFSPREKALSEFVFPVGCGITAPWLKVFRNLLIATLAAFGLGLVSPGLRLWVLGLGLFVTFCQALARIFGSGQAFQPTQCSGVNIPMYAAYAIGFRELARVLFKYSFVQSFFLLPFLTLCATLIAYLAEWPLMEGVVLGIKTGLLALASRFITVMFAFSSGTNDSARFRIRTFVLLAIIVGFGLLFLGLGAAGLFIPVAAAGLVPVGLTAWGLFALAVLDAYVMFRVYGWFYHANRFDLMKTVQ